MKTTLQKALATIAPYIAITTNWSQDPDSRDIRKHCEGFDDEDPDDWQAWNSEICASCIIAGDEVSASAYLGGTWEKTGDVPEESNPDISGYENQMTVEALEDLQGKVTGEEDAILRGQIDKAIAYCRAESEKAYAAQQEAHKTA